MLNFQKCQMVMMWAEEIQNGELRLIAMINAHHAQKQRALSTFLNRKDSYLIMPASKTGVAGAMVALAHRIQLVDSTRTHQYGIKKNKEVLL